MDFMNYMYSDGTVIPLIIYQLSTKIWKFDFVLPPINI